MVLSWFGGLSTPTWRKVVDMSGSTRELVAHQAVDSGIRLLEKPFTRADLLKTIDAALG
jgi:hypothetical protein